MTKAKAKAPKCVYIHTLDGKPAFFDGDQICFAVHIFHESPIQPIPIVKTLKQIGCEQRKTIRWRKARGYADDGTVYGFQKIIIP